MPNAEPASGRPLYYRARYYDPTIGRFVQRDPIGLQGGINQYAYADNSPTNNTDPQGTQAFNNALTNTLTFNTSYFNSTPTGTGGLWSGSQSLASLSTSDSRSMLYGTDYSGSSPAGKTVSSAMTYSPTSSDNMAMPVADSNPKPGSNNVSDLYADAANTVVGGVGLGAGATELKYVNSSSWLGNTGARYSLAFHGNQYVGGWNAAQTMSDTSRNIGTGAFAVGSVVSGYQGWLAYKQGDSFGVAKSTLDVTVGGAAWAIGGRVGFYGLGAPYAIGSLVLHSGDAY